MCRYYCNWSTNGCTCRTTGTGYYRCRKSTFGRRNIHRYYFQGKSRKEIQGLCSIADYCDLPELIGYAAGQASTGDCLEWFIKNSVPGYCQEQAREAGKDIFSWLSEQAEKLKPGQNGLLALDWWNGNRSCLADQELSGLILGLGLETRPEEIYRALLEACAFGVKRIFKEVEQYGIPLKEIHACGGITQKTLFLCRFTRM